MRGRGGERAVWALCGIGMLAAIGCGGGSHGRSTARSQGGGTLEVHEHFPTRASIAALPAPGPIHTDTGVAAGRWEIEAASLAPSSTATDSLYRRLAVERATAQRSASLECVARETARFYATLHGLPGESVRRFVMARCGAGAISVAIGVVPAAVPAGRSDEAAVTSLGASLADQVVGAVDPASNRVGLAIYRDGDLFFAGVASSLVGMEIDPVVPVASDGHLRLRARIARAPSELVVMTTSGPRAVAGCAVTGSPPDLDVDCPFAAGDEYAYVEIMGRDGDAVLCNPLAIVIGIPSEGAGLAYTLRVPTEPTPVGDDLAAAVLPLLNGERAQVGARALALSAEQSAANARVVPYAFDPTTTEQALLYVMAGWELGEGPLVREGRAIQLMPGPATDAGQWLFRALELPMERWVLLDPEARVVAIGAVQGEGGTVGLASTFRFFEGDEASDRARAEAALTEARRAAGHPAPEYLQLGPVDDAATAIAEGGDASEAVDTALRALVRTYASARGNAYVASVLERIPWAAASLEAPHVGIAVRHARPEGAAWGVYVVVVVALP